MGFRTFIRRFQVEYLTQALTETFRRFPGSVACCAVAAVLSIFAAHDVKLLSDDNMLRLMVFLAYGLTFFTAVRLYAESAKATVRRQAALTIFGGSLLLALAFVPDTYTAMHMFIGAALSLSMLFAPYIGRRSTEDSVWYYNYLNGVSLVVAGLSTFILCLGLCAIVGSMDYLLYDMKLSNTIYADIWIFGGTFFGPVMFMHQLSRQFDFTQEECLPPKGIYFIANYIVVPLILIYMWVLYVYFLKIAVQWELPKGNLAYMVTGFGSLGAAARLAVFPMRSTGTKLLQQFYRFFFLILIVPILLLAIGLYTRISQYGVTEQRYAIGVCLTWLTALALWNLARPLKAHIKHVPMALCTLFLLASVGPWGAVSVSTVSQTARLESLLHQAGVIHDDGQIAKTAKEVPFELRKDISGTLDYMFDGKRKAIARLIEPFRGEVEAKYKEKGIKFDAPDCQERRLIHCWWDYDYSHRLMEAWGMTYVSRWESQENSYVDFRVAGGDWNYGNVTRVSPYSYIISIMPNAYNTDWISVSPAPKEGGGSDVPEVHFTMTQAGVLTVSLKDQRKAVFDLLPIAEGFRKEKVTEVPEAERGKLVLKSDAGGFAVELRISDLRGHMTGDTFKLDGGSMMVLFTP